MKRGKQLCQERETSSALRKWNLPLHNFKQKKSSFSTTFLFQTMTYNSRGSNEGTEVKPSTKTKKIKFSSVLKCEVVGFLFFSESCFVNS